MGNVLVDNNGLISMNNTQFRLEDTVQNTEQFLKDIDQNILVNIDDKLNEYEVPDKFTVKEIVNSIIPDTYDLTPQLDTGDRSVTESEVFNITILDYINKPPKYWYSINLSSSLVTLTSYDTNGVLTLTVADSLPSSGYVDLEITLNHDDGNGVNTYTKTIKLTY